MKITSGLGSIDDYPRYVRAGADELFCGYVPFSWSEKYGTVLPLNRREVLNYNVQIGSFSELEILANMVQKYQKPVHLAFNSLYYRPEQYEEITQIIQQCRSIGDTRAGYEVRKDLPQPLLQHCKQQTGCGGMRQ